MSDEAARGLESTDEALIAEVARRSAADGQLIDRLLRQIVDAAPSRPAAAERFAGALGDEMLIGALRARSADNASVVYAHHVHAEVASLASRHGLVPDSVLELGPGANLGAAFSFAAAGVQRVAAVDVARADPPPPQFFDVLRDYLACVAGFAWWRYFSTASYPHASFPRTADRLSPAEVLDRIDYRVPVDSAHLPFEDGAFDLVYSVAALEHVGDPLGTVAECARVTRRGGLSIHEIDLTHHGSADPLKFLEWSDDEYRRLAQAYGEERSLQRILDGEWKGEVFCNRLRNAQWLEMFDASGFDVIFREPLITLDSEAIRPERFADPYRTMSGEDLSTVAMRLVARRR